MSSPAVLPPVTTPSLKQDLLRNRSLALAGLLVMTVVFGGQFVAVRLGVTRHFAAGDIAALRFLVAGAIMLPVFLHLGWRDACGVGWRRAAILAALAGAPMTLLSNIGLTFAPALHGSCIQPGIVPVAMALITATVTRSWPPRPVLLCLPVVVMGLLLMALGGVGLDGAAQRQTLVGDAIFVLAGSCWALFTHLGQRWRVTPVQATAVIAVLSCLVLPVQFALVPSRLATAPWEMIAFHGLYQGLLVLVVGLLVWAHGVRVLGTEVTSRFSSLVPVTGFALAIPIAGEWPAPLQWLGMLAIVGGLLGLSVMRRR